MGLSSMICSEPEVTLSLSVARVDRIRTFNRAGQGRYSYCHPARRLVGPLPAAIAVEPWSWGICYLLFLRGILKWVPRFGRAKTITFRATFANPETRRRDRRRARTLHTFIRRRRPPPPPATSGAADGPAAEGAVTPLNAS